MAITINIPGGTVQLTGNPVVIEASGGSAPSGSAEYRILLRVASTDGKLTGGPFIDAIAPDGLGEAVFDISGYVDQPVTAVFQWPLVGSSANYPTQAFNITIEAGERYIDSNGDQQIVWSGVTETMQLLKGGLSPRQVAALRDSATDFYTAYILGGKWLTARPWGDYVHPTQPVKLWYLPAAEVTTNFRVKGYYNDGSNDTAELEITLDPDNLYEFNCNPSQNGLELEPEGKRMLYFDVNLVDESETRRFEIDWSYCEYPVFMMFANTFGGVDDVYFKGRTIDEFKTEGDFSIRLPQQTDTVFTPTLLNLNRTGQNRWVLNSGYKSQNTILFYRDLLISKQAWYMYQSSNGNVLVIPVVVETANITLFDRSADLYSIEVAIAEAHISAHSFDNRIF